MGHMGDEKLSLKEVIDYMISDCSFPRYETFSYVLAPHGGIGLFFQRHEGAQHDLVGHILFADPSRETVLLREGSGDNTDSFDLSRDRKLFDILQGALEIASRYRVLRMNKPDYLCPHVNPPHPCER